MTRSSRDFSVLFGASLGQLVAEPAIDTPRSATLRSAALRSTTLRS